MYELYVMSGCDKDGHRYRFAVLDTVTCGNHQQILEWCSEHFGPPGPKPLGSRWMMAGDGFFFYFRDEDDAFAFRMRWC